MSFEQIGHDGLLNTFFYHNVSLIRKLKVKINLKFSLLQQLKLLQNSSFADILIC